MALYSAQQLFRTHVFNVRIRHIPSVYPSLVQSTSEFLIMRHFLMLHHNLSHYLFLIVCRPGKIIIQN